MAKQYKIDSVSLLYPALGGHVYRQRVVMKQPVDPDILRQAIVGLKDHYPIMCSHLVRTLYSYKHVPAEDLDVVSEGDCTIRGVPMLDTEKACFRLYVDGCAVSMDIFHGNGDGGAAIKFFTSLVEDYCALASGEEPVHGALPGKDELTDPYIKYYRPSKVASLLSKDSYKIQLSFPDDRYYVRYACISADINEIKAYTKPLGMTVNDFLCAALYMSIIQGTDADSSPKPVTISVPINMRPFFGSHSQRNFAFYSNVFIHREDAPDFESAMRFIHDKIKYASSEKMIRAGVSSVYLAANNIGTKAVPRALREYIIRKSYRAVTKNGITTTLSNVGYQKMNKRAEEMTERFEMYLGAGRGGINTAAVGLKDKVSFCFACGSEDTVLEDLFMKILAEHGVSSEYHKTEHNIYFKDFPNRDNQNGKKKHRKKK